MRACGGQCERVEERHHTPRRSPSVFHAHVRGSGLLFGAHCVIRPFDSSPFLSPLLRRRAEACGGSITHPYPQMETMGLFRHLSLSATMSCCKGKIDP